MVQELASTPEAELKGVVWPLGTSALLYFAKRIGTVCAVYIVSIPEFHSP
jgi:hypothetical protein